MNRILDFLIVLPQHLLPQHWLSHVIFKLTRWKAGRLTHWLIKYFIYHYQIDMGSVLKPQLIEYANFNEFFTRSLRSDSRPLSATGVSSPVDAQISQIGQVQQGLLLQAKQHWFSLETLLAADQDLTKNFENALYCTLYLSPRDYHRIHMPLDGQLKRTVYVPGRLFSVNQRTSRMIPNLFSRNERLICWFQTPHGDMVLILVGALLVSGLETVWTGPLPRHSQIQVQDYFPETAPFLKRGAEMGRFNMGSTVILLLNSQQISWLSGYTTNQSVKMGQLLANVFNNG